MNIHPGIAQALHLADGHAVHALHHQHIGGAVVPQHFRNEHQVEPRHIAAQLSGTRSFTNEIEFVVQIFVELRHHLARLEAPPVGRQAAHDVGHQVHEPQVFIDGVQHARTQHFDRHVPFAPLAVTQNRKMHLCNGGAGHRRVFERNKDF